MQIHVFYKFIKDKKFFTVELDSAKTPYQMQLNLWQFNINNARRLSTSYVNVEGVRPCLLFSETL